MNDNAIFTLVRTILLAGLASNNINDVEVVRSYQPTQQGTSSGKSIFIHKISDNRYGHPKKRDSWDGVDAMIHTEEEQMESTFQLDALIPCDPSNTTALTTSDIVNIAAFILQSDAASATLKASQVGIYRIQAIREMYIVDDYDNNESAPSFDFTLTHKRSMISETPILQLIEPNIYRV